MAQNNSYEMLLVESYEPKSTSDLHGAVHIRPVAGQKYPSTMRVECSKRLSTEYPVGTCFEIRAKLTDREGEGEFLYSYYKWAVTVIKQT